MQEIFASPLSIGIKWSRILSLISGRFGEIEKSSYWEKCSLNPLSASTVDYLVSLSCAQKETAITSRNVVLCPKNMAPIAAVFSSSRGVAELTDRLATLIPRKSTIFALFKRQSDPLWPGAREVMTFHAMNFMVCIFVQHQLNRLLQVWSRSMSGNCSF